MFTVYVIKNNINDKMYVGYTGRKLNQRLKAHFSCAKNNPKFRFHFAILKHGESNFYIEKLEENLLTENDAKEREVFWIEILNSYKNGYNGTKGGTGGWMISKLSKEKQEEWLEKITNSVLGKNNPKYSGIDNDEFVQILCKSAHKLNGIYSFNKLSEEARKMGYLKFPKSLSKFRGSWNKIKEELIKLTNLEEKFYQKTKEHKEKISNSISGKCWVSKNGETKYIPSYDLEKYMLLGYLKGRYKKC